MVIPVFKFLFLPLPNRSIPVRFVRRYRLENLFPSFQPFLMTPILLFNFNQIGKKFFYNCQIYCGIYGRRHRMRNHFRQRRHKILRCIFRRYTGIKLDASIFFIPDEIFIKCCDFLHIRENLFSDICFLFRTICYISAVMLRNPSGRPCPVNNNGNHLIRCRYIRRSACGHIDSPASKQFLSILPECVHPGIIVSEQ